MTFGMFQWTAGAESHPGKLPALLRKIKMADEGKLIDAYLKIRETHGRYPLTDAAKRAAVTKKYLDNGIVSDERGSFQYNG